MKQAYCMIVAAGLFLLAPGALAQVQTGATRPKPDIQAFQQLLADAYPLDMVRQKQEGDVEVSMCIDAAGAVSNVKLVSSSGWPPLDEATLRIVPQTQWQPAHNAKGKAVATCSPPFPLTVAWRLPVR